MNSFDELSLRASTVFTPAVPIKSDQLFAGRFAQITTLVDAINQPGQHAVLFGERGVGKTSLANVLSAKWTGLGYVAAPRIGCVSTDTFSDLWRKAFREIKINVQTPRVGFRSDSVAGLITAADSLPDKITHSDVRAMVTSIGQQVRIVLIFDEFDTLGNIARKAMAELVKLFSDYDVPVTLIFVGVANDVGGLLSDHRSIERALVQVRMPRMSDAELDQVITNGVTQLGMQIDVSASIRITKLSSGLPHYTHSLCLYAVRSALARQSLIIEALDVEAAVTRTLDNAQQSTIDAYATATSSAQKNHLFRQVLLACALSEPNELGYFSAAAVRSPLSKIMKKLYEIPSYARHLNDFCDSKRGCILERIGKPRSFRFRFQNPLMQPFVILQGYADKMLSSK